MNVSAEHNLHSCSRLLRLLVPLFSNETLLRLSVTRLTSAVTCFTGSAEAAAAYRTDFFSGVHADVPRVVGTSEPISCCCCLPTPMTLASGGSPMSPLVVHQPASSSIWPAVQSLRRGLSTNPGVTMWCVCGCS